MKKVKTTKKMKTTKYNYFYYGMPITRAAFLKAVPENWQDEVDEYGCYSWGGYRAIDLDEYAE
jgi:hypothetical protein